MEQKVSKVDYSKGLIYKLCCKDPTITNIYIGSTTNMRTRKNRHKHSCNNPNSKEYNYKVYQMIRECGGFDNWNIILVEYVNATSKQELEKEERVVIELLKPTLNCVIPTRTHKEYYEDHKEKILKYSNDFYHKNKNLEDRRQKYNQNKEKILEKLKEYRQNNKEQKSATDKKYREQNKEKIAQKRKVNYEKNKEQINEKRKVKVKCEFCECLLRKDCLKTHQKTIKCKKFQLIDN